MSVKHYRRDDGGQLTVKVLEVGELDSLAHSQDVSSTAEAVDHHPNVTSIQGRKSNGSVSRVMAVGTDGSADIGPGGNNG